MGLFRSYLRTLNPNYARDAQRRAFKKKQWRKRVDAQMRGKPSVSAARTVVRHTGPPPKPAPPPSPTYKCVFGHHHKVRARMTECNEKAARAEQRFQQRHVPAAPGARSARPSAGRSVAQRLAAQGPSTNQASVSYTLLPSALGPRWGGLQGGSLDNLYPGAWIIDANTGERCQVEQTLDDGWVVVCLADGRSVPIKPRPATADETRRLRGEKPY